MSRDNNAHDVHLYIKGITSPVLMHIHIHEVLIFFVRSIKALNLLLILPIRV